VPGSCYRLRVSNTQSSKGNPASHRMSNAALKNRRARSWRDSQARKQARIEAQHQRQVANRARVKAGEMLPWAAAEAERVARRAITCGACHEVFQEDEKTELLCCPECHGTANLRAAWLKAQREEQLPAS
jgi:protein-arginine kinase activator protein McsA